MLLPLHLNLAAAVASGLPDSTPAPTAPLETEFYMLTVAEISEITDLTNIFIWEEDAYNFGKVWG